MSVGTSPKAPAPTPADVGVVAATQIEVGPFLARLANVRKYAGPKFTVVEG
jgi:adenosylhomocysteine nucleosidase